MDVFTSALWIISLSSLVFSLKKNKSKTLKALKMGRGMMKNTLGSVVGILLLLGIILNFIPPEAIRSYLGGSSQILSSIFSALLGSITLIPAFVAFPLVGSLVDSGASVTTAVAFLTTLTMVGFVTFPLEKKEFGVKFALTRNIFSFILAVTIALIMGLYL